MSLEILEKAIWHYIFSKNFERFSSPLRKQWSAERKNEYEECIKLGKFILAIKQEASRGFGVTFVSAAIQTMGKQEDPNEWVGKLSDDPYVDLGIAYDYEKERVE